VRFFNPVCPVYVIGNGEALRSLPVELDVTAVPIEKLLKSESHKKFERETMHTGFWKYATERFFYLEELVRQEELTDVFHLENDVMLYLDVEQKLPVFQKHYAGMIGAVFDNDQRCIPGFLYVSDGEPLEQLVGFIAARARDGLNDMQLLSEFKDAFYQEYADHLPLLPPAYAESCPLRSSSGLTVQDGKRFSQHFEEFGSIFDAAALGQFLGGVDPIHGKSKPGFINESSIFNPAFFYFEWHRDEEGRHVPYANYCGKRIRINNLHIHCKNLSPFHSRNEKMPSTPIPLPQITEKIAFPLSDEPMDVVVLGSPEGMRARFSQARRIIAVSPQRTSDAAEWFDEKEFPFSHEAILEEFFGSDIASRLDKARYRYHPRSQLRKLYAQLLRLYAPHTIPGLSSNVLVIEPGEMFSGQETLSSCLPSHFSFATRLLPSFQLRYSGVKGPLLLRKCVLDDFLLLLSQYHQTEPWRAICRIALQGDLYQPIFQADEVYYNYLKLRGK